MNTVVYYPYMSPSAEWLRIAALCWDKVYRIKPPFTDDPDEIHELDGIFGGILDSVRLRDQAKDPWAKPADVEFVSDLQRLFSAWLEQRTEELRNAPMSSEEGDMMARLIGIHHSKFPATGFIDLLKRNGLLKDTRPPEPLMRFLVQPDWIKIINEGYKLMKEGRIEEGRALIKKGAEMRDRSAEMRDRDVDRTPTVRSEKPVRREILVPQDVGFHYLSLYASLAAKDLNSDIATDIERFTETILYDSRSLRSEITRSVLEAYIPAKLSDMDPYRILEFREAFATQRLKYMKEVQSITREYSEVASEGQLTQIKKRIVDIALERCEETKRTYRRAKLEMVVKSIAVTLTPPAIATTIASALGIGLFAPAGIAAALSLFVAARLIEWDRAKAERNKNSWSYVLDAGKL